MAASGTVIELRTSPAQAATHQLQAAVKLVLSCAQQAEGAELGELLIQIREAGIDPLEAAFATGVRRFDKSGEYAADGALRSASSWSACPRPRKRLRVATWVTSTSRLSLGPLRTSAPQRCAPKNATS